MAGTGSWPDRGNKAGAKRELIVSATKNQKQGPPGPCFFILAAYFGFDEVSSASVEDEDSAFVACSPQGISLRSLGGVILHLNPHLFDQHVGR